MFVCSSILSLPSLFPLHPSRQAFLSWVGKKRRVRERGREVLISINRLQSFVLPRRFLCRGASAAVKMVSSAYLAFAMLVSVAVVAQAAQTGSTPNPTGAVYIVHMEKTDTHANDLKALHLQTLSSLFGGSQEKAEESILYSYTNTMNGFSAKLTPEQVAELSKKPGVLSVQPQGVAHLHPAKAKGV